MTSPILALKDIELIYGSGATAFRALRGVSLTLERGALTLMFGPSGSGKTTLLQVMGCQLRPTAGTIRLSGGALEGIAQDELAHLRLAHYGFVFQHYHLFPALRAWENVAIALDLKEWPREHRREEAQNLLHVVGLDELAERFPAQLSGGQKQRVAIARAIAGNPDILLADEPTAALDGKTGRGITAVLHVLARKRNCAVLVVSHDPRVVPFADRVVQLEDGVIVDDRCGPARRTSPRRVQPADSPKPLRSTAGRESGNRLRTSWVTLGVVSGALALGLALAIAASASGEHDPKAVFQATDTIIAGGLVEPRSETRVIVPQLSGRIARIDVHSGDPVKAGQLLAELDNADYRAALASATAQVQLRSAELAKLRHGARPQDIEQARAVLYEARAQEALATSEARRREVLAQRKLISAEQAEQARAAAAVRRAQREKAAAAFAELVAGSRPEDIAAATAALAVAVAERDRAAAELEKTMIRSPVDGTVLKRPLNVGETVTALAPVPLALIGDLHELSVRADVSELDLSRIRVGARALISTDAFPGQSFPGKIVRISGIMGKRQAISDDPAERRDDKTLEALIELDGHPPLPIGLRVDVRIAAH